jgi:hypothetical protein
MDRDYGLPGQTGDGAAVVDCRAQVRLHGVHGEQAAARLLRVEAVGDDTTKAAGADTAGDGGATITPST